MVDRGQHIAVGLVEPFRDRSDRVLRDTGPFRGHSTSVHRVGAPSWCWAADTLAELGATVDLAHPLGARRSPTGVKNDECDAADLADLLRMSRLPKTWIAPPATRELSELVRHRAKLVTLRSNLKNQVHAVLAGAGVQVSISDLFGVAGTELLGRVELKPACRARVNSELRLISNLDCEVEGVHQARRGSAAHRPALSGHSGHPGVGPVLAAVFIAEIGDITRSPGPRSWPTGPADPETPRIRHHLAPGPDHRTGFPAGALGCYRGRAARPRAHPPGPDPRSRRRPMSVASEKSPPAAS